MLKPPQRLSVVFTWFKENKTGKLVSAAISTAVLVSLGIACGIFVTMRTYDAAAEAAPDHAVIDVYNPAMGDTPAILSLQKEDPGGDIDHKCTATLVSWGAAPAKSSQWAMTAAHCVTQPPKLIREEHDKELAACSTTPRHTTTGAPTASPSPHPAAPTEHLIVRGATKRYASGGVTAKVAEIHVAKNWSWTTDDPNGPLHDLALVRLDHALDIPPIPIATEQPTVNTRTLVYGWATRVDGCGGIQPDMRQWGEQVTTSDCEKQNPIEFCATTHGTAGPCNGASGGPLLTVVNGRVSSAAGVFTRSFGQVCGAEPDLFTSLAPYHDFLATTMSAPGGR